jgi:type IV fimbrial biogenesis protein FimT
MRGSRRLSGFTLISQLAALAIVGLLFAIAAPAYRDIMPRFRLQGAARQVVSDLMFARMKAVRENSRQRVDFLNPEGYQVLAEEEDGTWRPVLTRVLTNDYRGVELLASNDPVFNPGGRASVLATIRVRNESGERRVSVNITGRVKLE